MYIGGWLRSLGLEQYEAAFHENAVMRVPKAIGCCGRAKRFLAISA